MIDKKINSVYNFIHNDFIICNINKYSMQVVNTYRIDNFSNIEININNKYIVILSYCVSDVFHYGTVKNYNIYIYSLLDDNYFNHIDYNDCNNSMNAMYNSLYSVISVLYDEQ